MKTKLWAMGLVVVCTFFTAAGQYFWKLGSSELELANILLEPYLWIGFFLYGLSILFLIVALKGGELSALYPLIATSFIWVTIISVVAFNEVIGMNKILGIFTIIIGISFIGVGSK